MTPLATSRCLPSTFLTLAISLVFTAPALRAQDPGYTLSKQYKLGGEGGWDYLAFDTAGNRLFITRGTHVAVVNPADGTVIGDIPNTPHVHGVALAYDLGRGFITAAGDTSIHIFDLKTLKPLGTVKTEVDDDAIVYDASTKYVVSMNGDGNSATVVDGPSGKLVGNIKLPGGPEYAATDGHGMIYANIEDKSLVVAIDLKTMKIVRQWPLAPCSSPSGLAIDRRNNRLFSGCHNKVMAISDAIAGKVITTVPIGGGVDANRFDPGTRTAFSSNGDGTLTVVSQDTPDKYTVKGNVTTQRGARTMALDYKTHTIYLVTADFAPAVGNARPQPLPGTFRLLVVSPK
jgi:outer membrane protein assembly factor BamB